MTTWCIFCSASQADYKNGSLSLRLQTAGCDVTACCDVTCAGSQLLSFHVYREILDSPTSTLDRGIDAV